MDITEGELQELYSWVDEIPLSRPKRNIARDFSDAVLLAEIIHHYFPKYVDLHNYSSANGVSQKLYNWNTLNQKVLRRLGFSLRRDDCAAAAQCQAGSIERILKLTRNRIARHQDERSCSPSVRARTEHVCEGQRSPGGEPRSPKFGGRHGHLEPPASASGLLAAEPEAGHRLGAPAPQQQEEAEGKGRYVQPEMVTEREQAIVDLQETNEILETKVRKLEQLVRLKDAKIQTLLSKLHAAGLT